jgi:hypothetical protein
MSHRTRTRKFLKGRLSLATLLLAIAPLSLAAGGCSSGASTLDEVEALKTKVCACKDAACVSDIQDSSQGLKQKLSKLTGDEMDKALKLAVAMMECESNLGVSSDGL